MILPSLRICFCALIQQSFGTPFIPVWILLHLNPIRDCVTCNWWWTDWLTYFLHFQEMAFNLRATALSVSCPTSPSQELICIHAFPCQQEWVYSLSPSSFIDLKPTKKMQFDFKKYKCKRKSTKQGIKTYLSFQFKSIICYLDLEEKKSYFNDS